MTHIEFRFPCSNPATNHEPEVLGENEVLLRKGSGSARRSTHLRRGNGRNRKQSASVYEKLADEIEKGNQVILFDSSVVIDARDPDSSWANSSK